MKLIKLPFLMLVLTVFFACAIEPNEEETAPAATPGIKYNPPANSNLVQINVPPSSTTPYNTPVQKVSFSSGKSTVNLTGLAAHSVYLVKTNKGNATVSAANTGKVLNMGVPEDVLAKNARNDLSVIEEQLPFAEDAPVSGIFTGPNGETIIRYEHHPNNEKIFDAINAGNLNARSVSRSMGAEYSASPPNYTVGTSKEFWTQNESGNVFSQIATTLRATGKYSNVWVADANYDNSSSKDNKDNKITTDQAKELAQKFDIIYQKETAVFGFEYGGGLTESDPKYGGADGDPKIQILVYDIFDDFSSSQTGGVFGYFWSEDEFDDYEVSNNAEIFYIDAHFTDLAPDAAYSTLAHEFQHMINFNVKYLKYLPAANKKYSETWYNEMLSMLAEDLIDPFIEINADNGGHPIQSRIPTFLSNYYKGPTNWDNNDVYASYANAYALGAYLVRNFGGVDFVKEVMSNSEVDAASLSLALANSSVNPLKSTVDNFNTALSRYDEALLFNQVKEEGETNKRPDNVLSFNNTVTKTVSSDEYTFTGFDLFSLKNGKTINGSELKGPLVWDAAGNYSLKPHTVLLLSRSEWQNVTGSRSITLQQPADPNIEFYIIVR